MLEESKQVIIYADGACEPNPGGPGGYGVVLIHEGNRKELSGGFRASTNNRMEAISAIKGLEALSSACKVTLYSDSAYLVNAMKEGWAKRWKENNWCRNKKKEKAENIDLWQKLLSLCEVHQVEFVWVKGHSGDKENEICDKLSFDALEKKDLPADEGYEKRSAESNRVEITLEGQPCRKCSTPVVKIKPRHKADPTKKYYYEFYLYCPNCQTTYMVEDAKRSFENQQEFFLL